MKASIARTERESEKKSSRPVGAAKTSEELAEWCRLQQKNTLSLLKKRWPQYHKVSTRQGCLSFLYQKKKEHGLQSKSRDGRESRWAKLHLGKKAGGLEQQHGEGNVSSTAKESRCQGKEG